MRDRRVLVEPVRGLGEDVSVKGRKRRAMSATEFMARLQQDQEYQARKEAFDADLQRRAAEWRRAAAPIVADLRAVGVEVDSVWDLVNTDVPYPAALPVLIHHFESGAYPDRVMEGVGRALAVGPAVEYWDRLVAVYRIAPDAGAIEGTAVGAAVALAACASSAQLQALVDDECLGKEARALLTSTR